MDNRHPETPSFEHSDNEGGRIALLLFFSRRGDEHKQEQNAGRINMDSDSIPISQPSSDLQCSHDYQVSILLLSLSHRGDNPIIDSD